MPHAPRTFGPFEVVPLCDSTAPGVLEEDFPRRPTDGWASLRTRVPWAFLDDETWPYHVHAFAVRTDDDTIVVDSGLGDAAPPDWEMSSSRFPDELASAGVEPADVGLVVLTHLHVDHVGGVLDAEGAPRFPNARHVVHEADLDAFENAGSADRDPAHRATTALRGAGLLDPGTDDAEVAPGVTVRHAPGHTPGHRVVELGSSATLAVLCGDAVVHPVQVEEPARRETFDADPGLGARTRAALIERVAGTGAVLVPAHTARSFGRVSRTAGSRFRWVDVA